MELLRGTCSLCSETTKVLPSKNTEEFTKQLPTILYENFLPEAQFQKIKHLIKICAICCYKIELAAETQRLFSKDQEHDTLDCHFCKTDKCLMKITPQWKYFEDRTEGFCNTFDFPLFACSKCVFYFDTIYKFKSKLLYKFPQLAVQKKKANETPQKRETAQKQNDTPKRKSLSKSPPSSKKRKIFDNCFTYLQPLCNNNNYHIGAELRRDKRLYRKIAYIDLTKSKDINAKETPKSRPVIKIKLKSPRNKRDGGKSQPYILISKSEEAPKVERHKGKRRHSLVEGKESSEEREEKLEETPKSASAANLVPKRRVSTALIDSSESEEEDEKETKEEEDDKKENETEEKTEDKATPLETVSDEETSLPPTEPKETAEVDENGVDKATEEKVESTTATPEVNSADDAVNGEISNNADENDENENEHETKSQTISFDLSDRSSNSSPKSPAKSESNSEGSDSDTSGKDQSKDNAESDVLNGSERKKKRVTFSDEVDN